MAWKTALHSLLRQRNDVKDVGDPEGVHTEMEAGDALEKTPSGTKNIR